MNFTCEVTQFPSSWSDDDQEKPPDFIAELKVAEASIRCNSTHSNLNFLDNDDPDCEIKDDFELYNSSNSFFAETKSNTNIGVETLDLQTIDDEDLFLYGCTYSSEVHLLKSLPDENTKSDVINAWSDEEEPVVELKLHCFTRSSNKPHCNNFADSSIKPHISRFGATSVEFKSEVKRVSTATLEEFLQRNKSRVSPKERLVTNNPKITANNTYEELLNKYNPCKLFPKRSKNNSAKTHAMSYNQDRKLYEKETKLHRAVNSYKDLKIGKKHSFRCLMKNKRHLEKSVDLKAEIKSKYHRSFDSKIDSKRDIVKKGLSLSLINSLLGSPSHVQEKKSNYNSLSSCLLENKMYHSRRSSERGSIDSPRSRIEYTSYNRHSYSPRRMSYNRHSLSPTSRKLYSRSSDRQSVSKSNSKHYHSSRSRSTKL